MGDQGDALAFNTSQSINNGPLSLIRGMAQIGVCAMP